MRFLTAFLLICLAVAPAMAQQAGWIGITIEDGKDDGAMIQSVQANSITSVDNRTVRTPAEFDRELRTGAAKVSLRVIRDKKEQDITIDRTPPTR